MNSWIMLTEQKPPYGKRVLIIDKNNYIAIYSLLEGISCSDAWEDDFYTLCEVEDHIIGWQPLPEGLTKSPDPEN